MTVEEQILKHLEDNGQKLNWLADKIKVSDGHFHFVMKGEGGKKRKLTKKNLDNINAALGTKFKFQKQINETI